MCAVAQELISVFLCGQGQCACHMPCVCVCVCVCMCMYVRVCVCRRWWYRCAASRGRGCPGVVAQRATMRLWRPQRPARKAGGRVLLVVDPVGASDPGCVRVASLSGHAVAGGDVCVSRVFTAFLVPFCRSRPCKRVVAIAIVISLLLPYILSGFCSCGSDWHCVDSLVRFEAVYIGACCGSAGRVGWIDAAKLLRFIIACQDSEDGGISDRPGNTADVYHTFFGIAGMALLGYFEPGAWCAIAVGLHAHTQTHTHSRHIHTYTRYAHTHAHTATDVASLRHRLVVCPLVCRTLVRRRRTTAVPTSGPHVRAARGCRRQAGAAPPNPHAVVAVVTVWV